MVLTKEELEIKQFFDEGLPIQVISECTGRSVYRLKKLLTPDNGHYIFRQLDEQIPDCQIFT